MKVILPGASKCEVQIDRKFYKEVMSHCWYKGPGGYYTSTQKRKNIYLHHFILSLALLTSKGRITDHINRDKKDNRLRNLRFVNTITSAVNRGPKNIKKHTPYKGVVYSKQGARRWIASYTLSGKYMYIGRYATDKEAARAYNKKVKEIYGQDAYQNKIMGEK